MMRYFIALATKENHRVMPALIRHPVFAWIAALAGMTVGGVFDRLSNNRTVAHRWIGLAICALAVWVSVCAADEKERSVVNCDVQNGACTRPLGGGTVTLEIQPRPVRAMADLTFRVIGEGLPENASPFIDLNMLVMDMGKNRVSLKRNGQGAYEGRGVIVRCRSGVRTWSAKVTFPGAGTTEFIFDVVY